MYVKHLGADVKLHRARQVLAQLESRQQQYLTSDNVWLESSPAPGGPATTRIRITEPPPAEISELAHAALRTTREALDDLAVSLAVASRRTSRGATFPIAASAHAYLEHETRCLRHANEAARSAVRSVTPWQGGDDKLWELHCLALSTGPPAIGIGQVVTSSPLKVPIALNVLQPGGRSVETCRRLQDDSALVPTGQPDPDGPADALEAGVRLVIAAGELVRGGPVVSSIEMLIAHASMVVDQVVSRAERR